MTGVSVHGVGTTLFARQPGMSGSRLMQRAVNEALDDAGADVSAIEAVYGGSVFGGPGTIQRGTQDVGITGVPILRFENACATGSTAFHEAVEAVRTGRYETVLCVGVETMTTHFTGPIVPEATDREGRMGLSMPAIYALAASRYAALYGADLAKLALVAVKNRFHGSLNPRAQRREAVSMEAVLGSRMIAEPLTRLQCCDISDAAAAVVVGRPRVNSRDVAVRATALGSGDLWDHRSVQPWGFDLISRVARSAWEQAGVGPEDIDLFEMHDAFTIGEIITSEAMGLASPGEGLALVECGETRLGGRRPINPSGGLLSRGHPLGATGLAQIAEVTWQLRGDAGARQVKNARLAAVETMGGGTAGVDGNGCVVAVLEGKR